MAKQQQHRGKAKDKGSEPVHRVKIAAVEATVWRNENDEGAWYNVTCRKSYQDDKGEWHESNSYGLRDAASLACALQSAVTWIAIQEQRERDGDKDGKEPF